MSTGEQRRDGGDGRSTPRARRGGRGWRRAVLGAGLAVAVAAGLLAAVQGGARWLDGVVAGAPVPPPWQDAVRVVLAGEEAVYLSAAQVRASREAARGALAAARESLRARLDATVEAEVARVFAAAEARVPDFLDWYYSLPGAYLRLLHVVLGDLEAALEAAFLERVLAPAGTEAALADLVRDLEALAAREVAAGAAAVQGRLLDALRASPGQAGAPVRVVGEWRPDAHLAEHLAPYLEASAGDLGRQGAAVAAGAGVAATTGRGIAAAAVARTAAGVGARSARATLGGLAVRLGLGTLARSGGPAGAAAGGAATGASVCAASVAGMPLTPACAVAGGALAGAAAWLLVDKAVLEVDEHLNRAGLQASLDGILAQQRDRVASRLRADVAARAARSFDDLLATFDARVRPAPPPRDFVPLEAARGAPS